MELFANGTVVRTVGLDVVADDWTPQALASQQWDVVGVVVGHHDSHGLTYEVKHPDGTVGYYEQGELRALGDTAEPECKIEALADPARELAAMVLAGDHFDDCSPALTAKAQAVRDGYPTRYLATVSGGSLTMEDEDRLMKFLRGEGDKVLILDSKTKVTIEPMDTITPVIEGVAGPPEELVTVSSMEAMRELLGCKTKTDKT